MSQEVKIFAGIGVITLVIFVAAAFLLGGSPSVPKPVDASLLVKANSNKITYPQAKVTLVEFGDYQCPACGAIEPAVEQLRSEYKGKVNFVFRNFPLPMHQNAVIAAKAAEAAGMQGKFWQMHDLLYAEQNTWGESSSPTDDFLSYAKQLQLNTTKFQQALSSAAVSSKITGDQADGNSLGVDATPTFYINAIKFTDIPSYAALKQALDTALSKAK